MKNDSVNLLQSTIIQLDKPCRNLHFIKYTIPVLITLFEIVGDVRTKWFDSALAKESILAGF